MPITAQSADGVTHEFPDGTKPDVIDRVMKDYADKTKDRSTTVGQTLTGMADPVEGGGELVSDVLPKPVTGVLDKINNAIAPYSGGLIRALPEGGKPEQMRQREAEIAKTRGANTSMDWARMAGNILSPVNWIGLGLGPEVKAGMTTLEKGVVGMEKAEIAGATSAAMQPTTSDDRAKEKMFQLATGTGIGAILGLTGSGVSHAVEKLGEYVARNHPDNLLSQAVTRILKRIQQDEKAGGPSATEAINLVNAARGPWGAREGAKPMTLTDVAGENTKGLAGNVARQPGESRAIARNFLKKRDEDAAKRLASDVNRYVSGGPTAFQATEALLNARSAAARPLYQTAHKLQGVWSPRLEQFLGDPVIKQGLSRGYELERLQALAEGRDLTASQMGVDLGVDGSIKILSKPNMLLLDMAKQGLDAMVADERNEITGRLTKRGLALDNVRKAYVKTIDDLDPTGAYKKARASWAGHSASLDAIRLGRTSLSPAKSPEEVAAEFENLSPGDREFYRIGMADLLKERLAKAGLKADEAKQLIKNPWMRDQLRPAFRSTEDFDNFVDAVTAETQMFETGSKIAGNSLSAERLADDHGDLAGGLHAAEQLAFGGLFQKARTAYRMWRDLGIKPPPEMNEKIAQILFTTDIQPNIADLLRGRKPLPSNNPANQYAAMIRAMGPGMTPAAAVDIAKERAPQYQPDEEPLPIRRASQ